MAHNAPFVTPPRARNAPERRKDSAQRPYYQGTKDGETEEVESRTDDDFDRLFMIARDAERLIDAEIFLPKAPDWQCAGCAYRKACMEAYGRKAA